MADGRAALSKLFADHPRPEAGARSRLRMTVCALREAICREPHRNSGCHPRLRAQTRAAGADHENVMLKVSYSAMEVIRDIYDAGQCSDTYRHILVEIEQRSADLFDPNRIDRSLDRAG